MSAYFFGAWTTWNSLSNTGKQNSLRQRKKFPLDKILDFTDTVYNPTQYAL